MGVAYGARQPDDPNLLLLYTARMRRFLDADERAPNRSETIPAPGLKPSERIAEWLSDHLVAAVASDTVGVQALSPNSPNSQSTWSCFPFLGDAARRVLGGGGAGA
jgi:hypothetical protein